MVVVTYTELLMVRLMKMRKAPERSTQGPLQYLGRERARRAYGAPPGTELARGRRMVWSWGRVVCVMVGLSVIIREPAARCSKLPSGFGAQACVSPPQQRFYRAIQQERHVRWRG